MKNPLVFIWSFIIILSASCTKENLHLNDKKTVSEVEASNLKTADFNKNFGGSKEDIATAIATSKDGSYVIAGRTLSNDGDILGNHGLYDGLLIKIDKNGNKIWAKCFGGSNSDEITGIAATEDGGYIFTGSSESSDGDLAGLMLTQSTLWIVKLNSQGVIEWSKVIPNDSPNSGLRQANSIIQTKSGDYVLAGKVWITNSTYNGWYCKLTNLGSVLWEKSIGSVDSDRFQQVVEEKNGNLWLVGTFGQPYESDPISKGDVWLAKVDKDGNITCQQKYGGSLLDEGNSLALDKNRGIIIAGTTYSSNGDVAGFHGGRYDAWVIKVDMSGKKIWQKSAGGTGGDLFSSVIAMQKGGFLLAGQTNSQDGDVTNGTNFQTGDGWLVKLTDSGDIQSQKTFGGGGGDAFYFIAQGLKNNIVAGGVINEGVDFNAWVIGIISSDNF
ncbi:hypothetical protein [Mucilaginibacter aquariorum]|uniref:T9SS C-terminal target domain-containing protein n=1 Tax=Mucilaginibacter aquariorum TaxID=2967225 RepID=A0ABT1T3W4_9SPHI|nr:hypothetical protein [Mucilaginibacter aquariorum]MCQ6959212.1 hypothetical protein [Mucilaginibacter aquariorum]